MRQIYEIFIDLEDNETGVFFNSAVYNPAHRKAFYAFSKDVPIRSEFNDEKQNIIGVAISADTEIFRNHKELGEHDVTFTKENVSKMAYKFMRDGNNNKLNFNHDGTDISKSAIGFLSYIIDTANGFPAPKAFEGENEGSWLLGYHFTDKEEYDRVKNNFTGWSVEGDFYQKILKTKTNKMSKEKNIFQKLIEKFTDVEEETPATFETATLTDGTIIKWDGELAEGSAVFVETDEGDVPAPDGEHMLDNGVLVVTEGGLVTSITEAPSEDEQAEAPSEVDEFENQFSTLVDLMFKKIENLEKSFSAFEAQKTEVETLKNDFNEFKKGSSSSPEKKKFASTENNQLNARQRIMLQTLKNKK